MIEPIPVREVRTWSPMLDLVVSIRRQVEAGVNRRLTYGFLDLNRCMNLVGAEHLFYVNVNSELYRQTVMQC